MFRRNFIQALMGLLAPVRLKPRRTLAAFDHDTFRTDSLTEAMGKVVASGPIRSVPQLSTEAEVRRLYEAGRIVEAQRLIQENWGCSCEGELVVSEKVAQ